MASTACVLTQEYQYQKGGKEYKINHPITFASGLFKGSQMNWAALTKEAFAIYSSIKKLSYYLEDADIVLRSDHLPLKKFLQKNTLNSKVNNWAVEISPYRIKFEYIKGIKNTLACKVLLLLRLTIWWTGFLFCCFLSVLNFWGMFVRVYPKIIQGLTFLNSVKHITIILARCTS